MGFAHERIAKEAPQGSDATVSGWRRAQASYQKARETFGELEGQGKRAPEGQDLAEVRSGLERVSAALDPKVGRR
jgi:hypothetical protein